MNAINTRNPGSEAQSRAGQRSGIRLVILAFVFLGIGMMLTVFWFSRANRNEVSIAPTEARLSDATLSVLRHLESPVEVRFYSRLDPASVDQSVQTFAQRVDQLLERYEQAGGNRITVLRFDSISNFNANAASADGIKAFNIDKGDSCFLGVAVVCNGQKESLSYIAPEWEQALEPDLTRAIARASEGKPGIQTTLHADPATIAALKRMIPDVNAISLEDGTKLLRNASLAEFIQAAQDVDAKVKDAQVKLLQAQGSDSETAAEALRKIQSDGADKLKQIALDSHVRIAALQQLKKASP